MNLTFLYYIAGFLVVVITGLIIWLFRTQQRDLGEPENEPLLDNFLLPYCPFRRGVVSGMWIGEKRIKIEMYPRDINYIRAKQDEEYEATLRKYTLFFDKRQVEIESGDASPNRVIIKAYPNDPDLLPEGIKNTTEGKAIMMKISKNNEIQDESELMKQRMSKLKNVAGQTFGGEIFEEFVDISKEIIADKSELVKKEEKKSPDKK